jgi:hypothetical protein
VLAGYLTVFYYKQHQYGRQCAHLNKLTTYYHGALLFSCDKDVPIMQWFISWTECMIRHLWAFYQQRVVWVCASVFVPGSSHVLILTFYCIYQQWHSWTCWHILRLVPALTVIRTKTQPIRFGLQES